MYLICTWHSLNLQSHLRFFYFFTVTLEDEAGTWQIYWLLSLILSKILIFPKSSEPWNTGIKVFKASCFPNSGMIYLSSEHSGNVKWQWELGNIQLIAGAECIRNYGLRVTEGGSAGPPSVELADESLGAVVLVLEDHVILPDLILVGHGDVGRNVAYLVHRDSVNVSDLNQLGCPPLPCQLICWATPSNRRNNNLIRNFERI